VPQELEEALCRGKPGFLIGGFGGAGAGYANERDEVFTRLRNGLPASENRALAASTDVDELVRRIISQVQLLPLIRENVKEGGCFESSLWMEAAFEGRSRRRSLRNGTT